MAEGRIKRGDTAPALSTTLKDPADDPVNLADADVTVLIRHLRGTESVLVEPASNDQIGDGADGTKGQCSYQWAGGETEEVYDAGLLVDPLNPGGFYVEWEVTYSDGSVETFPNSEYDTLAIIADIGGAS